MPFTISHAAAVIPLNRRPFVLSALIIGSMSPDFLYFIPFIPNYAITHAISGLFLFCLPASLTVWYLYHHWLKRPIFSLLPRFVQCRLPHDIHQHGYRFHIGWLAFSSLTGAFTHIFWDNFTHSYGRAVQLIPMLAQPAISIFGETLLGYKFLQYLSTVVGGLIIVVWTLRWFWQTPPQHAPTLHRSKAHILMVMMVLSGLCGMTYGGFQYPMDGIKVFVVQTVIVSMSMFCGLLGLYSLVWHTRVSLER